MLIIMESTELLTPSNRPESAAKVSAMFDTIAGRYDLLNTVLSCGMHKVWERKLIAQLPDTPQGECLDLCTGTGALIPSLKRRFGKIVGVDISPGMLAIARKRFGNDSNVELIEGDAQSLCFGNHSFDAVTVAYGVRNWPNFQLGLSEVHRVLKIGGCAAILEFGQPVGGIWAACFNLYSRYVIPAIGGLISGSRAPYEYLPKTAATFPCGESFVEILKQVGFRDVKAMPLFGGVAFIYLDRRF
jgi:demethylmenaquinone methyltransferase/2-methoxy-6-polyprenyl-1,4-benzoquinol methylase